jgi:hypothetical protein
MSSDALPKENYEYRRRRCGTFDSHIRRFVALQAG